ncbi:hypothetical protein FR483_n743R [Paramecium bursaria Chlorella virus FR483]|uniref:Uncharacterized protein n743R n=1 Tax=Paramecium bursaria Chlorella virus FR483 TaxID=399781 RepID=A7J897_PBCVF|nr:hypothetical protein FR483_n743R [Paramecium bursaria Chlorella virus FR483]ABT16028.1 hypothetical protein FR483_n743R [Paramecium bursaria Chlorella virus FR483]
MPVFSTKNLPAGSKISNSPASVKEFTIHNAKHFVPFGSSILIILPEPLFDSEYAPAYSMLKDVLDGSFVWTIFFEPMRFVRTPRNTVIFFVVAGLPANNLFKSRLYVTRAILRARSLKSFPRRSIWNATYLVPRGVFLSTNKLRTYFLWSTSVNISFDMLFLPNTVVPRSTSVLIWGNSGAS